MASKFTPAIRRTGFAFAIGILLFSALAAANPTDKTAIGELSTSQIEDELQVHKNRSILFTLPAIS